jgi:uncharacterized alkaline shock family protein YloU
MDERDHNELGTIRISDDAIGVIAGLAAREIQGVASTGRGPLAGLGEVLGMKPMYGRGVKVEVTEEDVYIDLHLIVEFGVDIPLVCQKVQDKVKETVEDMTGLSVARVNVAVQDVQMKSDKSVRKP